MVRTGTAVRPRPVSVAKRTPVSMVGGADARASQVGTAPLASPRRGSIVASGARPSGSVPAGDHGDEQGEGDDQSGAESDRGGVEGEAGVGLGDAGRAMGMKADPA